MSSDPESRRPGRKQRLLLRVERFSRQRYRFVFLVTIIAVLAASYFGSKLELESDVLELIPEGNPKVDTFKHAVRDFGSIDYLLVLLEIEGEESAVDELTEFADVLAARLADETELVEVVEYRLQLDESFEDLFYDNALLFLPPDQLAALSNRLTDQAIRDQIAANRLNLTSPTGSFRQRLIKNDPLGLTEFFIERLIGSRGAISVDLSDGYYLSEDGQALIMLVKPTRPSQDMDFSRRLLAFTREAVEETRAEIAEELDVEPAVEVSYSGNYAMTIEETELIVDDAKRNLTLSLFLVCALYWLCYRRFAALFYSSVPLMVGQALTFGVAFLFVGGLNSASSSFTALLMGLGTDFTIVMYARYVEERRNGVGLARATELMVGETGLGVFTGAITSAGTFYAMCISRFRGLSDMGFLIGSGILLCGVAIVFLLPAMITWNEGVRPRKSDAVKKLHLQSFLLEYLIPFSARFRIPVLIGIVLLTAGAAWLTRNLTFNDSLNALRSNKSESYQVQQRIAERFGASLSYMMAIAYGDTVEEAALRAEQVRRRLQPFVDDGTIGSYDSILTYLPPEQDQLQVIETVQAGAGGVFDPDRIASAFRAALDESGFREEPFAAYLARMGRFLRPERPLTLDDFDSPALQRIVGRYVRRDDGQVRVVTYLFPTAQEWKRRPPPGLVEALEAGDPRIVVTGTNVVGVELRKLFFTDIGRAVFAGIVLVFALLWIDFRSLKLTAVAMAQLIAGVALMLGWMSLLEIELNFVNSFVATMILGVGIDYSIHLVHRLNWSDGKIEPGLLETGKAVVMAALTNMAGFGALAFGNYPALRSFGLVALLGSITCLFTALTVVPALMARRD